MPSDVKADGSSKAVSFSDVLEAELEQIDARRSRHNLADPTKGPPPDGPPEQSDAQEQAERHARERRLVGLSFSGGGIRSATFNLGVLRGLAGMGLLKFVDYLSTVSGGGYIGSWLVAWIKRQPGGIEAVERQLASNRDESTAGTGDTWREEPKPITHLRQFSNYLAPRTGFLSADTWVLAATYLRNFLLSQLVILPAVVAVLLVSRLTMMMYHPLTPWDRPPWQCFVGMGITCGLLWLVAFTNLLRAAMRVRERSSGSETTTTVENRMHPRGINLLTFLLLVAALVFCWFAPYQLPIGRRREPCDLLHTDWGLLWLRLGAFAAIGASLALAGYFFALGTLRQVERPPLKRLLGYVICAACIGVFGGLLLYGSYSLLHGLFSSDGVGARDYIQAKATAQLTTFGPPLVLGAMVLVFSIGVGVLKHSLSEDRREWWSSLCARLLIAGGIWMTVNLVALYGTALVLWAGPLVRTALASGWLMTVAVGVLGGGSDRTPAAKNGKSPLDRLVHIAPHVFVIGLLIGVSLLIHVTIDNPPNWRNAADSVWIRDTEPQRPPVRVTETVTRAPGLNDTEKKREDVVERSEMIDDSRIVIQMYWVGMLNTQADFVPRETYRLSKYDVVRLQIDGVAQNVRNSIPADLIRTPAQGGLDRKTFLEQLDGHLPNDTSYRDRLKIIQYAKDVKSMDFQRQERAVSLFVVLIGCVLILGVAAWRIDVNLFSLHALYGNRLVRAYLGASRPKRGIDPITGLDPNDDMRLGGLLGNPDTDSPANYDGPYPLINTAMNLVHGSRLDWQERKAASFVMTPLYCGSSDTSYRRTTDWDPSQPAENLETTKEAYGGNVMLGTAVTLSGAAASPNMGYHSSPFVTALLTVFNARLGGWLGNPGSKDRRWTHSGPTVGFWYLFRELFGITHTHGGYIYLSDGGHFENLGAYELIRRRCQYVIVSDGGNDGGHAFEDLGNLIRKCRVDFGIRIEIDLDSLRLRSEDNRCRWHCAIGKIRYDDVDPHAVPGTLVYLKPSLTGDEPRDVLHYKESHPHFPHETTGDQFFNESQFESYRALGQHVVESIFQPSLADMEEEDASIPAGAGPGERHRRRCRSLFASLMRRWFAMPPRYEESFMQSAQGYAEIQQAFRDDPRLWRLAIDLYPELDPGNVLISKSSAESAEERAARLASELQILAQILQTMENAYLGLKLEEHYAHPLNRGWMDVFHRWTGATTLRLHWPLLRAEFGREFVRFCEKQMRLGVVLGRPQRLRATDPAYLLDRLLLEFEDQWSTERRQRVEYCLDIARQLDEPLAWAIYSDSPYPLSAPRLAPPLPAGLILVFPAGDVTPEPNGPTTYDLLVWLRGAYRNTGLGRPAVDAVLRELRERWNGTFRLRVVLPISGLTGPGDKMQKAMWLTFFHHHEFVRVRPGHEPQEEEEEREVELERVFPTA